MLATARPLVPFTTQYRNTVDCLHSPVVVHRNYHHVTLLRPKLLLILLPYSVMSVAVCLSTRVSQKPLIRTSPNILCKLSVAMARSSSGGVHALYYVLPVCMRCFSATDPMVAYAAVAASLQCCALANTPAAWYWLRPVLNDGRLQTRRALCTVKKPLWWAEYAVHHCLVTVVVVIVASYA